MTTLKTDEVWYFGYASNLSEQRFHCYILGGKPLYGKACNPGCEDRTLLLESESYKVPYKLYFGLPGNRTETRMWGPGGVAFISPLKDEHREILTLGRIYRIKRGQYNEIRAQEGINWYNHEMILGEIDGIPVLTITHSEQIQRLLPPAIRYLKTIAVGLKEAYHYSNNAAADYLISKQGISGYFPKEKILEIIDSCT